MESRAEAIAEGRAAERVWLIEHPPLYTSGASAKPADLLDARFPVYRAGRGGQFTYHGPGQRVAYVMLDLKRRRPDVRAFVAALEGWLIDALAALGVEGETREDRVGVWVARPTSRRESTARRPRTRSRRSASGCGAGRRFTACGSTSRPTWRISPASSRAASAKRIRRHQPRRPGRAATMADADRALKNAFERASGRPSTPEPRLARARRFA